jgi:hypothetical protein
LALVMNVFDSFASWPIGRSFKAERRAWRRLRCELRQTYANQ